MKRTNLNFHMADRFVLPIEKDTVYWIQLYQITAAKFARLEINPNRDLLIVPRISHRFNSKGFDLCQIRLY